MDVKKQMESKEDFEILESPLAEKQEGMGQNQSRWADQGRQLQGCTDNKGPAWTGIVLESRRIIHMPSSHHLCPSFRLFCLTVSTTQPFTPCRLPLCHFMILLNLHVIQLDHTQSMYVCLLRPCAQSPAPLTYPEAAFIIGL